MSQLGWIDENGMPVNQTMDEDIMSLPLELSAQLTEEAVGECAMEMISQWAEDPQHAKCADKYTEEDVERLTEVGVMMANYKCFNYIFSQSCKAMVESQIYEMYSSSMPTMTDEKEEVRTFQRASCFSICTAANFASTTTCTFGFFFRFTRTCNQVFPVLALAASG
jgi:hypothetical protein